MRPGEVQLLHNPRYAGAFAYVRSRTCFNARLKRVQRRVAQEAWQVLMLAREMKCQKLGNIALDRATQDSGQRQQAPGPVLGTRQQDRGPVAPRNADAAQAERGQR